MPAFNHLTLWSAPPSATPIALLQVDMDTNAERLFVIDRTTLEVLWVTVRPLLGVAKCRLPSGYGASDNLLVGILDDNRNYNVKAADGVRCEIVQSSVDMSQ